MNNASNSLKDWSDVEIAKIKRCEFFQPDFETVRGIEMLSELPLHVYVPKTLLVVNYKTGKFGFEIRPEMYQRYDSAKVDNPSINPTFDFNLHFNTPYTQPVPAQVLKTKAPFYSSERVFTRLGLIDVYDPLGDGSCLFASIVRACYGSRVELNQAVLRNLVRSVKMQAIVSFASHITGEGYDDVTPPSKKKNLNINDDEETQQQEHQLASPQLTISEQLTIISQFGKFDYYNDKAQQPPPTKKQKLLNLKDWYESFSGDNDEYSEQDDIEEEEEEKEFSSPELEEAKESIRVFLDWLMDTERGYVNAGVFGDHFDVQLLANLFKVNILLVDIGTNLPRFRDLDGNAFDFKSSLGGDLFTLQPILPQRCSNEDDILEPLVSEVSSRRRIQNLNSIASSSSSGDASLLLPPVHTSPPILQTHKTIILARIGKHYKLLRAIHPPLLKNMLTSRFILNHIYGVQDEMRTLVSRMTTILQREQQQSMIFSNLMPTEQLDSDLRESNCENLQSVDEVVAWKSKILQTLDILKFMFLRVTWKEVKEEFERCKEKWQLLYQMQSARKSLSSSFPAAAAASDDNNPTRLQENEASVYNGSAHVSAGSSFHSRNRAINLFLASRRRNEK